MGGTFTDIVLRLLRVVGVEHREMDGDRPCTTVAPNTILQKTAAAVTGLITTRGFRDVLEIGRVRRPDLYELTWEKPPPLVPRRRRLKVDERIAADGESCARRRGQRRAGGGAP